MTEIIYGRRPVQEFLKSNHIHNVRKITISPALPNDLRNQIESIGRARIEVLPNREISEIYPDIRHQGVVIETESSTFQRKSGDKSTGSLDIKQWKDAFAKNKEGPIVLLDRIQDPQNLGSILRTCEALGVKIVFITGKGAALSSQIHKSSAGATFHLHIFEISSADNVIREAKKNHYYVAISSAPEDIVELNIEVADLYNTGTDPKNILANPNQILLIIGSEGEGVKPIVARHADFGISIALHGQVASLNAAVATGILLDRLINRNPRE